MPTASVELLRRVIHHAPPASPISGHQQRPRTTQAISDPPPAAMARQHAEQIGGGPTILRSLRAEVLGKPQRVFHQRIPAPGRHALGRSITIESREARLPSPQRPHRVMVSQDVV
jgi:hypothetical protein